jgi:hypothetical protein
MALSFSVWLHHLHIPVETFIQRYKGFCSFDAFDLLQLVVKHGPQLGDVLADDLGKHAVIARCIVQPHDLRYFLEVFCNGIVERAFFEVDADKGDDIIAKLFQVCLQPATFNDPGFL